MSLAEGQRVPRFKVDENLPVEAAEALRIAGYDALTVLDPSLAGSRWVQYFLSLLPSCPMRV